MDMSVKSGTLSAIFARPRSIQSDLMRERFIILKTKTSSAKEYVNYLKNDRKL